MLLRRRSVVALFMGVNKQPPLLEVAVNMRTSTTHLICSLLRLASLVEACIPSLGPPTNGGKAHCESNIIK